MYKIHIFESISSYSLDKLCPFSLIIGGNANGQAEDSAFGYIKITC